MELQGASAEQRQNEVELEIAAFMGPHIKRARIFLVLLGGLYAYMGYKAWDDVSGLRDMTKGVGGPLETLATQLYVAVVMLVVFGVANVVLALIAGTKTMLAFYAAMGIFVVHSVYQLYISGGVLLTSWIWWLTLIILGMGFQAAYKAEKLRKGERPAL